MFLGRLRFRPALAAAVRVTVILAASAGLALPALAQDRHYIVSASTTALTVQQTAANPTAIEFASASVYCVASQTATISWNGTAASATTTVPKTIPPTLIPASVTAYTGSNAGAGTTGPVYNVPGGATMLIDLSWFRMGNTGTTTNLTITTTGTCTITILWTER